MGKEVIGFFMTTAILFIVGGVSLVVIAARQQAGPWIKICSVMIGIIEILYGIMLLLVAFAIIKV